MQTFRVSKTPKVSKKCAPGNLAGALFDSSIWIAETPILVDREMAA